MNKALNLASRHQLSASRLRPWRPANLGNPDLESKETMGIAILSALSIAGIHSAVNPSYFTLRSFAAQPEAKAKAREGLWIGLGLSTVASLGLYLVFEEWVPAIVAEATAVALFGIGLYAVEQDPLPTMPPIERQQIPQTPAQTSPV